MPAARLVIETRHSGTVELVSKATDTVRSLTRALPGTGIIRLRVTADSALCHMSLRADSARGFVAVDMCF